MNATRIRFRFQAYGQNGDHEAGFVDALDEADAVRQLRGTGKVPYEVRRADETGDASLGRAALRSLFHPRLDLTRFFSDLSIMLNSGFNIDIALKAVADSETDKTQKLCVQAIHALITEGKSVADAFSSQPEIPVDVIALVASGENSGRMDIVFSELAKTYALRARHRSEILEALLYPAFLVFVMFCALMLLSLYLVPAIQPIFENVGATTPIIVRLLGAFGHFVSNYGLIVLGIIIGTIVLLIPFLRTPGARARFANIVTRIPLAAAFLGGITRGRYLNTMALLLGNGVPMLDAMDLAARTAPADIDRTRLLEARQAVAGGESLWQALGGSDVFPDSILSLVQLGEQSNNLAPIMARAGLMTQTQMQRSVSRALTFITPAITILLGIVVGALVVSVMTTLLSINEIAVR